MLFILSEVPIVMLSDMQSLQFELLVRMRSNFKLLCKVLLFIGVVQHFKLGLLSIHMELAVNK